MISLSMLRIQISNLVNIEYFYRIRIKNCARYYSVYPKYYNEPIFNKEAHEAFEAEEKLTDMSYSSYRPALSSDTSSEFYNPVVEKFVNYLTKEGKKINARCLLENAFEKIKIKQLKKYNTAATPEQQNEIELDPKRILAQAIENASPMLELNRVKLGSQVYRVPTPVVPNRSKFLGVKWILLCLKEKSKEQFVHDKLAEVLLDTYYNKGSVIKKKEELYKQCIANKSYAHYRWTS